MSIISYSKKNQDDLLKFEMNEMDSDTSRYI